VLTFQEDFCFLTNSTFFNWQSFSYSMICAAVCTLNRSLRWACSVDNPPGPLEHGARSGMPETPGMTLLQSPGSMGPHMDPSPGPDGKVCCMILSACSVICLAFPTSSIQSEGLPPSAERHSVSAFCFCTYSFTGVQIGHFRSKHFWWCFRSALVVKHLPSRPPRKSMQHT
jgi:hypothetical protein